MPRPAARNLMIACVLVIAWGALAFGGVYRWAYVPLAAGCAALGLAALWACRPYRTPIRRLSLGLAAIGVIAALQLVPLPDLLLARVSPATDRYLRTYDLSYVVALAGDSVDGISYGAASRPVSIAPERTRTGLFLFAAFGLFFLGLTAVLSVTGALPFVRGIVVLGAGLALIGVVQYTITGGATYTLKVYGFWTPESRGAPFGPFINRNHFAGWMLMGLPLAMTTALASASMFRAPQLRRFIGWLSASPDAGQMQLMAGACAVMLLSVMVSSSRSGLLGLGVAVVLATALLCTRLESRRARAWTVMLAVFFVALSAAWAGVDGLVARLGSLGMEDDSAGGRLQAWGGALRIFRSFPLFGSGLNTYGAAMQQYQSRGGAAVHFNEAHNDYLQVLAEGGLLMSGAVLVTLLMFISTVRERFREAPREGTTYWLRAGAVIGLAAVGVQSLVEFSLQMPGNAALFCALAAIAVHRSPNLRFRSSTEDFNYGYPAHS